MNVAPLDNQLTSASLSPQGGGDAEGPVGLGFGAAGPLNGDAIARFVQPQSQASAAIAPSVSMPGDESADGSSGIGSMLSELMQMMQTMMSALGLGSLTGSGYATSGYGGYGYGGSSGYGGYGYGGSSGYGGYGGCSQYGNEQYYQSATGASQGDPHLSFNGSTWDNMASQPNLLNSNSFSGGYQISTQATSPNAKGITYNQSATIALDGGAATVSMNNSGQASIQEYGQNVSISPGQTVQLGNGDTVTCNQSGSLTVIAQNGMGGQITTTLAQQGKGVNVNVSAQNVDLGGTLVTGGPATNGSGQGIAYPQPPPITTPVPVTPYPGQGVSYPQPPLPPPIGVSPNPLSPDPLNQFQRY